MKWRRMMDKKYFRRCAALLNFEAGGGSIAIAHGVCLYPPVSCLIFILMNRLRGIEYSKAGERYTCTVSASKKKFSLRGYFLNLLFWRGRAFQYFAGLCAGEYPASSKDRSKSLRQCLRPRSVKKNFRRCAALLIFEVGFIFSFI